MIKGKKKIISLLTAGLMTMSLVGCSSTQKEEEGGATEEKKTLTVWSKLKPEEDKSLEAVVKKFGEEKGVDVKFQHDSSEEFQAYMQAANSKKGPDVMVGIPHDNLGTFEKAGLLSPAPEGIFNADDYVSQGVSDAVTLNGKTYAMPLAQESIALFYNKDLVTEVPATMEELVEVAKEKGFMFDLPNFYFSYGLIAANGGYVYKNNDGTLDPTDIGLGNEGSIKGYQFLQDLVVKHKLMPVDIKGDIASSAFKEGKSAFFISGAWETTDLDAAGMNYGVAPIPTLGGNAIPTFLGVQTSFVSSKSDNQELAWELNKYIAENMANDLITVGNRLPVLKSAQESEAFKGNEIAQQFAKQAEVAVPMPNIPEVQAMWGPAGSNLALLITGELTPEEAGKAVVEQIKEGIAQQK